MTSLGPILNLLHPCLVDASVDLEDTDLSDIGSLITHENWLRYAYYAKYVLSLEYDESREPVKDLVPHLLALGAREHLLSHTALLPSVRRISWTMSTGAEDEGPSSVSWPFLLMFLSPELPLKHLSLFAPNIEILDGPRRLAHLGTHIPSHIETLQLRFTGMDGSELGAAVANLLPGLPFLRELSVGDIALDLRAFQRVKAGQIKRLVIGYDTEDSLSKFSQGLRATFSGLQLLHFKASDGMELDEWEEALHTLQQLKTLRELHFLLPRSDGLPVLSQRMVREMGRGWRNMHTLNLANVFCGSPQVLQEFSNSMPHLQKIALYFTRWSVTWKRNMAPLQQLEVLSFNVLQVSMNSLHNIGSFLGMICVGRTRIADCSDTAEPTADNVFSNTITTKASGKAGELMRLVKAVRATLRFTR